ncbi:DUF4382 domain-containing protein [Candidatus Bathyarchaeota archaeon A05DMB-2]|nr:DUF4382 domain-containing protein [Candidatus Bathyarchaeota archaeon A05DMB-2]
MAAVIVAVAIIGMSVFANLTSTTSVVPTVPTEPAVPTVEKATFAILLTDPPTVPAGTTQLNMTYHDIMLHVIYPNGTDEWLPVGAEGTVNLFSLINMTQTIASITIPINSTVDKVQFTIANVTAVVNEKTYNVTSLSDTFVVNVVNGAVNKTLSGVLIDFNPTLVQIQASDENDATVYYYVLVPSANAIIVENLTSAHVRVGTIIAIGENNRVRLIRVKEDFSKNLTIVSATLTVNGNNTGLSVTIKNEGEVAFRIFGLTLHGEFNTTQTWDVTPFGQGWHKEHRVRIHPETIPFKLNGTTLVPLYGTFWKPSEFGKPFSSLTINPGESATLNFSDVIALYTGWRQNQNPLFTITPIVDGNYTLRLMGEGFQTFTVKATLP